VNHVCTRYSIINESMKELLIKKFWRDVKTIFDEAREETTLNSGDSQAASSPLRQSTRATKRPRLRRHRSIQSGLNVYCRGGR
jgi:hypothetical protein